MSGCASYEFSCCSVWWFCFFFFKQKTAYEMRISDWSSDVCSSDLNAADQRGILSRPQAALLQMVYGAQTAQVLYVAAKLGVADLLKNRPRKIGRASCRERVCQYV